MLTYTFMLQHGGQAAEHTQHQGRSTSPRGPGLTSTSPFHHTLNPVAISAVQGLAHKLLQEPSSVLSPQHLSLRLPLSPQSTTPSFDSNTQPIAPLHSTEPPSNPAAPTPQLTSPQQPTTAEPYEPPPPPPTGHRVSLGCGNFQLDMVSAHFGMC